MKTILGCIKIYDKTPYTEQTFREAAKACNFPELVGIKCFEALTTYAEGKTLNEKFLFGIPDEEIEQIKGIKAAGHTIITYLKLKAR